MQRINLSRGTVQGHPDGFGFFIPDDGRKIWFCLRKKCGQ